MKAVAIVLFWIAFIVQGVAAWGTHVFWCIEHERWILLLAGAIAAPVGWVHGWMIWLGYHF